MRNKKKLMERKSRGGGSRARIAFGLCVVDVLINSVRVSLCRSMVFLTLTAANLQLQLKYKRVKRNIIVLLL